MPGTSVLAVAGSPVLNGLTSLNPVFFLLARAGGHTGTGTENGGGEKPLDQI